MSGFQYNAIPRWNVAVTAVVCAVLVASTLTTAWLIAEALEERRVVAAIADLRLAAGTVAATDALATAGIAPIASDLDRSVARLSGDNHVALHSLTIAERAEARGLIDGLAASGIALLNGEDHVLRPQQHAALQDLLEVGAQRASDDAVAAEELAGVTLLVAASTAMLAVWFLVRTRFSELRLRRELVRQATTDHLTALPNRRALDHVLEKAKAQMGHGGCITGLLFLDLDGFKDINDTLGHRAGDELLAQVARRLQGASRGEDVLVRLGGDEFAVVLPCLQTHESAERAAYRYSEILSEALDVGGRPEVVRTSIGVATTDDPQRIGSLAAEADIAMYEAKRSGGNAVRVFDEMMAAESEDISRITRALRAADYDHEFSVVYQPIVTVDGTTLLGHEALLRWDSPTLGRIPPDRFIKVAERSGEISDIGRWVLGAVCRQLRQWADDGRFDGTTVSYNVSAHQLANEDFVHEVLATLEAWGVPRDRLVVEVTESAILDHAGGATERLEGLRKAGIKISIDDFGSGYSNLGQLLQVPFDVIKIDRSLLVMLSEMRKLAGGDPSDPCAIMASIVAIAGVFGAPVVCEGVETEEQRRSLAASGITHVQGYLIGKPVPAGELENAQASALSTSTS